jgi:uncharacterized protein (DUF1697 family)
MTRYIAFLRAVNVGGRTVKMDELRTLFAGMGFTGAVTFIASGNVIFAVDNPDATALQSYIEGELKQALGYAVATFLRTDAEVAAIARYEPFPAPVLAAAGALNVAFLAEPLSAAEEQLLMTLKTAIDDFHVHGREVYWLCQTKQSESTFSNTRFERTLRKQTTLRGINTVRKLAAQYAP